MKCMATSYTTKGVSDYSFLAAWVVENLLAERGTNLLTLLFYALIMVWKIAQIEQNVQKSCPSHPFEGKVLKLFGSMKH